MTDIAFAIDTTGLPTGPQTPWSSSEDEVDEEKEKNEWTPRIVGVGVAFFEAGKAKGSVNLRTIGSVVKQDAGHLRDRQAGAALAINGLEVAEILAGPAESVVIKSLIDSFAGDRLLVFNLPFFSYFLRRRGWDQLLRRVEVVDVMPAVLAWLREHGKKEGGGSRIGIDKAHAMCGVAARFDFGSQKVLRCEERAASILFIARSVGLTTD